MIIAAVTLLISLLTLFELWLGFRLIKNLSRQPMLDARRLPAVSIILSALNEASAIEKALCSLLEMDYPNLEVIAINDRSDDDTPFILNQMKVRYPQLQIHHVSVLPENWIGKNHALYIGSQHARGEWLLFTDADVHMKPDTLSRAMSYALAHNLQHLTINEHHLRQTFGLKVLLLGNYLLYSIVLKPWRIRYGWSKRSIGNGAFNLVNKKIWFDCGSHGAMPLACLDDLRLGEIIKKKGYRQDIVDGQDYVQREWYRNLPEMIEGWKKNTFAWFGYRLFPLSIATAGALLFFIWPLFSLLFCRGDVFSFNAIIVFLTLGMSLLVCQHFRLAKHYAIFYPAAVLLVLYAIWHSALSIYQQQGVFWRNTFYSLKKLKEDNS